MEILNAAELRDKLSSLGVEIYAEGDRLRVNAPSGALTQELQKAVSASKAQLLELLNRHRLLPGLGDLPDGRVVLSSGQRRLWLVSEMDGSSSAYNIPFAFRLHGPLDADILATALADVVGRHAPLRTIVETVEGVPTGRLLSPPTPQSVLVREDLSRLEDGERDRELSARLVSEASQIFDLTSEILLRGRLVRLGADDHVLIIVVHHVAADGVSLAVFMRDLSAAYTSRRDDKSTDLPVLPIQYADYAAWQQRSLETDDKFAGQIEYWRRQLSGAANLLALSTDRPRGHRRSRVAGFTPVKLEPGLVKQLTALGRRREATVFAVILAGYAATLGRLAGQKDVVIGTPVAGRNHVQTEDLVGFFVNTLPLRLDLSGDPDAATLVDRAQAVSLDAFDNQDVPFERILQELALSRTRAHTPLFQAVFALQNHELFSLAIPRIAAEHLPVPAAQAKYDLTLTLYPQSDGSYRGEIEFDASLFDEATVGRWSTYLIRTLEGMVASTDAPVAALPILDQAEKKLVLGVHKGTAAVPAVAPLHRLFETRAAQAPDSKAVVAGDERLTYRELNARANRLAHALRQTGVQRNDIVGLAVERNADVAIGILAILKAGAAYLPLDPDYPRDRIAFVVGDATARVVLASSTVKDSLQLEAAECLDISTAGDGFPDTNPDVASVPDDLAYVIYTSGSTGKPKGVLVTHANVARLFSATDAWFAFGAHDVWTLFHSYAFDFSVWELWGALLYGGCLVVVPYWVSRDPAAFRKLLVDERVTILNQTPSAFRQLIQADLAEAPAVYALREIIFGGEALGLRSLKPWIERYGDVKPRLVNMYGITETTVHVTYRPITRADVEAGRGSVIGRPIPDLYIRLLDERGEPVPVGVPGEIWVGGAGVAKGYLNRPELTAQRFVPDAFDPSGSGRLYRAGDLARRLPDGDLEYLGRIDAQVKIRGFRIELGEIEAALAGIDSVAQSVVIPREIAGDLRLVAYLVSKPGVALPPANELRTTLAARLPDYMVPAAFVSIDAIPLTVNGKIDRELLPMPKRIASEESPPVTKTEQRLAEIWKEILGIDSVGKTDDFFELGGHSLLAVRLLNVIETEFDRSIGLAALFESSTIESLALAIEGASEEQFDFRKVVKLHPSSTRPQIFGINSTGAYYLLAKQLGPEWPLTSLQLFDPSYPVERMPESIEQIAAQYVQLIRGLQPKGPYSLLSWCAGNILTMEVAQQLLAANEKISFLGVIEGYAPFKYKRFQWLQSKLAMNSFRIQWNLTEFRKVRSGELSWRKFLFSRRTFQRLGLFRGSEPVAAAYELWLMESYLSSTAARYQLKTFPGRIHLFRASQMPKGLFLDDLNGWAGYAAEGVELKFVEGDHHSIFRPPGVDQLAKGIAAALAERTESPKKAESGINDLESVSGGKVRIRNLENRS